jgi:DNA-binding NtrC family response regulator
MLIEPRRRRRQELERALRDEGFDVVAVEEPPPAGPTALKGSGPVMLACSDQAAEQVRELQRSDPLVPVLVHGPSAPTPQLAMALVRARAYDYLLIEDSADLPRMRHRLEAAVQRQAVRSSATDVASEILGVSRKIQQVRRHVGLAAASTANVLVTGESGTGKELVARAIHEHSSRSSAPFVAVNCSAIPENLLESELFGHEKGSFTGADRRKPGQFELADGGTLLFDEIGEMPAPLQAKLLRVLQPPPGAGETVREFTRVGADAPMRADVRLIFATNRELVDQVHAGAFRQDLYQRMNVVRVHQPPLRERREDVPLLAQRFLDRHADLEGIEGLAFDPIVLGVLQQYDFPLNVRELEGRVRSMVVLKEAGSTVVLGDLPPEICRAVEPSTQSAGEPAVERTLAEVVAEHVTRVFAHADGNKSRAARILGISRPALDRKLAAIEAGGGEAED